MSNQPIVRIKRKEGELILIGTAHVSKESVDFVSETIEKEKPDNVALELCEPRLETLTKKKKWEDTPVTDLIKGNKAFFFLAHSMLSSLERRMGEKTGVKPGDEMLAAAKAAKKVGAKTELVDRPISITLKRVWKKAGAREKTRLMKEFFKSLFGIDDIEEKDIEELKKEDVLTELMNELGKMAPTTKSILVDERDRYIAAKLNALKGKTVAVVGAGHLDGIKKNLRKKTDITKLEDIPKRKFSWKLVLYAIPIVVIALFIAGYSSSPSNAVEMAKHWIIINGVFSALGALAALPHPLTVVTAFVVAPVTSLLPFVGAGWVAGLVEAKLRPPTVKDFRSLRDLSRISDFWRNRLTKILLVAALANLGSVIGTFVALPFLVSLL